MKMNSKKGTERKSRVELKGENENDRSRPRKAEDLCEGTLCHKGTRKMVTSILK